ncbi:response regulator [Maricaulis parjimensis]|uniref:response regulator n=1 Tax=Maricaulis parjimensis TaxID=144023 RepID=UPI00193A1979|nr:response regulator [Maricaulis parjimensis]
MVETGIPPRVVTILLVEDDDIDAEAVQRSLTKRRLANPVIRARNGREALDMLRGKTDGVTVRAPFIILLDLNMPVMNGLEFLAEVRADPVLHSAVIMVLTTSNAERDRAEAYEHNVAAYILKARAGMEFEAALELVDCYWRYVEFPD